MVADREQPEPKPKSNAHATQHHGVHHPPTVELIQQLSAVEAIQVTGHAAERLFERWVTIDVLRGAISNNAKIVDEYPDDPRGHCCLLECQNPRGDVIHCVCAVVNDDEALGGKCLLVITVFDPE